MANYISYGTHPTRTLAAGETGTLACSGQRATSNIVIAFGREGSITYNGTETAVEAGKKASLLCADKKMLTDVVVSIKPALTVAGLYDEDDNLVAEWDTLVNTYGMDIEKDYGEYPNDTTILSYLIDNNSELSAGRKLIISDSVTRIGDWAFYNLKKYSSSIVIPNSVTSIGEFAFCNCWGIKSITLPDSVTTVGESVFNNCNSLVTATLPNGLTHISRYAFYYCTRLTSVTIPDSVTTIGFSAFNWCTNLTDVYYGGTEERWRSISIDNTLDYNKYLLNATIHYNYEE